MENTTLATVRRAYRLKLYPNAAQRVAMARHAGSCRWLWNHLLDLQQQTYKSTGKFVFFNEMSKLLPGLKRKVEWLADAPSNALVRVCKNLDRALRESFRKDGPQRGFPKFKIRGKCREAWYAIGQAVRIVGPKVVLPKTGAVRFRASRLPEGRIVGGNVHRVADEWFVTLQCEVEVDIPAVAPDEATVVGVDLGLSHLMVASDGVRVKASRHLRAAQRRMARAQKVLMRRKRGSANRRKAAMRVARLHVKVASCRADATHMATRALVDRASAVVTEALNVRGMLRNTKLALSISDVGWGELVRQVGYKCEWAGKAHVKADRFFPLDPDVLALRDAQGGGGQAGPVAAHLPVRRLRPRSGPRRQRLAESEAIRGGGAVRRAGPGEHGRRRAGHARTGRAERHVRRLWRSLRRAGGTNPRQARIAEAGSCSSNLECNIPPQINHPRRLAKLLPRRPTATSASR